MAIQTEYDFELPMGYVDPSGTLHKRGTMRLATALDEITVLGDPKTRANEAYIVIALLARVVTSLGSTRKIDAAVIENLFAADLSYLQTFYQKINETGATIRVYSCPHCGKPFEVDLAASPGE